MLIFLILVICEAWELYFVGDAIEPNYACYNISLTKCFRYKHMVTGEEHYGKFFLNSDLLRFYGFNESRPEDCETGNLQKMTSYIHIGSEISPGCDNMSCLLYKGYFKDRQCKDLGYYTCEPIIQPEVSCEEYDYGGAMTRGTNREDYWNPPQGDDDDDDNSCKRSSPILWLTLFIVMFA